MKILYKCRCMQDEASFEVAPRKKGEDLMVWMAAMQKALGENHRALNPICVERKVEYVKIPLPENATEIGAEGKLHS